MNKVIYTIISVLALTSIGVVQMVVACLEDVVAVGFQLELVILERLPGEGSVEIA